MRAASPLVTPSLTGRAVLDVMADGLIHLFWRHQHNGFDMDHPGLIDDQRQGVCARIVWKVHEDDCIHISEGEVECLELSAETSDGRLEGRAATRSAFAREALHAVGCIRCL